MKRFPQTMMALPMLLGLWVVLSGADQGCYLIPVECQDLDEAACLENPDCRPIYSEALYDGAQDELPCGPASGVRCIGFEPTFMGCEERPTCSGLDEGACLAEPTCQAVYGFSEDTYLLDGTRCGGARCIEPPEVFLECVEAGADFCAGLPEDECLRRPACEAEYDYPGCEGDVCWDGMPVYRDCHLRGGSECTTDSDCYMVYGTPEDGMPSPACFNWYLTCEGGLCVEHCEEPIGCQSDADCLAGERCEIRCGNGWCEGVCVADQTFCITNEDCPSGFECVTECPPCPPDAVCEPCAGTCQPVTVGCQSDADCPEGQICQLMPCDCMDTDPDCFDTCLEAGGVCVPVPQDCQIVGCPEGQVCEVTCYDCAPGTDCEGGCFGTCVPSQTGCASDADCPEGFFCQFVDWCEDGTWCGEGVCVPATQGCGSDLECAPGERCEIRCGNGWCEGVCVAVQDLTWVEFDPMQCVETPWEADLAANPELYLGCMIDCGAGMDCGSGVDDLCVLGTFLANLGVAAQDLRHVTYDVAVCEACGVCPRGDAFYALVPAQDVELLLGLGFRLYGIL